MPYAFDRRDPYSKPIPVRFHGGRQEDTTDWTRAWSEHQVYSAGTHLAAVLVEGLSQRIFNLEELFEGFNDELEGYRTRTRRWRVDKARIREVMKRLYETIRDADFATAETRPNAQPEGSSQARG